MMLALAAALLVGAAGTAVQGPTDSVMTVTLEEALERAAGVDPDYIAAMRGIVDAKWQQRAAYTVFIVPATTLQLVRTHSNVDFFNIGTGGLTNKITQAQADLRLNVFSGGSKIYDVAATGAGVAGAEANEIEAKFQTALLTESDYYDVLAQRELTRVAEERVRRADEQLAVARARVMSGAAVQTDSLQLLLELTRAQVGLLQQRALLRVARIQLGRRIGVTVPVDAAPLARLPEGPLPITEQQAVMEALGEGPRFLGAKADARAAENAYKSTLGAYLPRVDLFATWQAFGDEVFLPDDTRRWLYGVQVSLPIWNNAQREIQLSLAKSRREVARALRDDTERAVRRDVIEAYEVFTTARASARLAREAVVVASENLRVQEQRYRSGATTILDLLSSQVSMVEAEAGLVQALQAERLALAGLEALLGRRIYGE
jgi:outer membrane protein TolC